MESLRKPRGNSRSVPLLRKQMIRLSVFYQASISEREIRLGLPNLSEDRMRYLGIIAITALVVRFCDCQTDCRVVASCTRGKRNYPAMRRLPYVPVAAMSVRASKTIGKITRNRNTFHRSTPRWHIFQCFSLKVSLCDNFTSHLSLASLMKFYFCVFAEDSSASQSKLNI